jgi:co-chaperonin GroES (HSP10)
MPQTLYPLGDDVIIHPLEPDLTTASGLHLSDAHTKKINQGIVIAKGAACGEDYETGDHVLFNPYTGSKIAIEEGGYFFVIPEQLIEAVLVESEVRLLSSHTLAQLLDEREAQLHQQHPGKERIISVTFDDIRNLIQNHLLNKGFEW